MVFNSNTELSCLSIGHEGQEAVKYSILAMVPGEGGSTRACEEEVDQVGSKQ